MCRHLKLTLALSAALALLGGATWAAASLAERPPAELRAVPAAEHARTVAAMKPPKRQRPVIAVLGHNDGTETTDFLIPYGVLAAADVADVVAVAPRAGRIALRPALAVEAQQTLAQFDARHAQGADYVIVAAMHPRDDAAVIAWLQAQRARGAILVGVCSGVRTLSAAGLLAGRSATRYWYDADDLADANPTTTWVPDRRYVVDRGVVTTTGITASLPVSLALVEAIGGPRVAARVARRFGVASWDARHDSDAFGFDAGTLAAALGNKVAAWHHESVGVPVADGVDEVALGFTADSWSRTFRSRALALAAAPGPVRTRHGLNLLPDRDAAQAAAAGIDLHAVPADDAPAQALPASLRAIAARYGEDTAAFVAQQLEYPWHGTR